MVFLCLFRETGLHVNFSKSSSLFHKSFLSLISSSERSSAVVHIVKVLKNSAKRFLFMIKVGM